MTKNFQKEDMFLNEDVDLISFPVVLPLLLLFCQCGGANTIFPDQFTDLPFEAKEHLISYHTEGNGKDEVGFYNYPINLKSYCTKELCFELIRFGETFLSCEK